MQGDFDLGTHSRPITTVSEDAQGWFDLGLNWCYGFNHEEGIGCFQRALEWDETCAMAHWGIAYATGPFYNLPWRHMGEAEAAKHTKICHAHVAHALSLAGAVTPIEADLISALCARFQKPHAVAPEEFDRWDDDYADAMREVYRKYPDDLDVMAIFAEALITRTPWRLWNSRTGEPTAGASTLEALEVLDRAKQLAEDAGAQQHPAILHLHIHTLEMSTEPERALGSAHVLGTLCPDAGHMNHMPGHIYTQCGLYEEVKAASIKAIRADRIYGAYAGPYNFYTTSRCHNLHLMMYACMHLGQYQPALEAAEEMSALLTPDVLTFDDKPQMTITMEGYCSMEVHVLVRFGKWHEIIAKPLPGDQALYCVSTAMHHYAKTVAHAALGRFSEAQEERAAFAAIRAQIQPEREFFNNAAQAVLAVAEAMMEGELAYHKGEHEAGLARLREAVQLCDELAYSEPWPWMHPPRHALGALLCEQGQYEEAETVFKTDLGLAGDLKRCCQNEGNIWALHGLAECLSRRGAKEELAKITPKLQQLIAHADVPVMAACCCRKQTA